jgi:hypothetical protein
MASKDVIDTLIAEAGGEGEAGLIAAAWAIQQRAAARGQTIDQVIKSGFDGYSNPGSGAVKAQQDPRLRAKVEQIMTGVQNGTIPNPVPGADHFLSGDVQPSWLKGMKPVATIGGHRFYASGNVPQSAYGPLIPPGELPEVATALATAPTPRPPLPVTPSIDLAQYRKNVAPSQLGPQTFAALSKPKRYLGDEVGMSPIMGGKQEQPMFDAAFDTRVGAMRPTNYPVQGSQVGASKAPAPVPHFPSAHLTAKRANDPVLQASLNAKYPAKLPPLPPPGIGGPPTTKLVQSTPVPKPGFSYAGQDAGVHPKATHVTSYAYVPPASGFPTTAQITAATGFRPPPAVPDRLPQGVAGLPALYGTGNVAGVGTKAVAPQPFARPPSFPATQVAQGKVAPVPFNRPTAVGTQLAVKPMPPMPIPRPPGGIGGPDLIPSAPMPAQMSPLMALQRSRPTLRPPTSPAAQRVWMTGFSDSGSSGGAHGGSENDKRRGETITPKGRSY